MNNRFLLLLATTLLAPGAWGQIDARTELNCDLRSLWRLGAPALALQEFPQPTNSVPLLYLGQFRPRGAFVLRAPGTLAATPQAQQLVLRSPGVDLTSQLALTGAQYQGPSGASIWVEPAKLPKLTVRYDPEMLASIVVPSRPGTCVMLFEIGEGREDEWAAGLWTLKFRFDAGSLNARLLPFGLNGVLDPAKPDGSAMIFEMQFIARRVDGPDHEANLALYEFEDARATNGTSHALAALDRILSSYPNEGNLRYQRALLLQTSGRKAEALADLRAIEQSASQGTLRTRFQPPGEEPMSSQQAQQWLRARIQSAAAQ